MDNNLVQIKIKERLNKLSSFDYDNIECWQIAEAFNKAQLEWVRRQIHVSPMKESDESSKMQMDDVQNLLLTQPVVTTPRDLFEETTLLPANYLYFKRISLNGEKDCCPSRKFTVYLDETADVDNILGDEFKKPSWEWGETFCTMQGNRIRIYTNNEFGISNVTLTYYRKPREIQFNGCVNISTGTTYTSDVTCEFKDDVAELIIDNTVVILAGDIESYNQMQVTQQRTTLND